jgi:hypothetical protein
LSYQPKVTTVQGTFLRKTVTAAADQPARTGAQEQIYWLLDLPRPVCINEDERSPQLNKEQKAVSQIELVIRPEHFDRQQEFIGQQVIVSGSLFGAYYAHHAPALLVVDTMRVLKK